MSKREDELIYMEYLHRETGQHHHSHEEDSYQYQLLKAGDPKAAEVTRKILEEGIEGPSGEMTPSKLRSAQYMFAAGAALASRAAIEAGVDNERAINLTDLYIRWMDEAKTVEEVINLHVEMVSNLTQMVANLARKDTYSRKILKAMDYIYDHLHDPLTIEEIADQVDLSRSYFSTLFRQETGMCVSDYIREKWVEAAKNMLSYSDMFYVMISNTLGFSSQSHFIQSFKKSTGFTPRDYRSRMKSA